MSITDELKRFARDTGLEMTLAPIADRIDAKHESALMSEYNDGAQEVMSEDGYVKLPVDADGVPWHIGDESDHGTVDCMTLCDDGCWMIEGDDALYTPSTLHHVQPDTWGRIIEDACRLGFTDPDNDGLKEKLVERCHALAGEDE